MTSALKYLRRFSRQTFGVLAITTASAQGAPPTLTELPPTAALYSEAFGVSRDGEVVVGYGDPTRALFWPRSGPPHELGALPGSDQSVAIATNTNGTVVVGYGSAAGVPWWRAVIWTSDGDILNLGVLPGGRESYANAVSDDGSIVVGHCIVTLQHRAFRWNGSEGMTSLPALPGGIRTHASDVSGDGGTVVGWSEVEDHGERAVLWVNAAAPVSLGVLPGFAKSLAKATNSAADVIVGMSYTTGSDAHGFRWTIAGLQDLGTVPGWTLIEPLDVSDDGNVIVGRARTSSGTDTAFIWTPTRGLENFRIYLQSLGVDTTGWHPTAARSVSADGSTIAGAGGVAWVARDVPVPCISIVTHPSEQVVCSTSSAAFHVTAVGQDATFQWQWRPEQTESWLDVVEGVNVDPFTGDSAFNAAGSTAALLSLWPPADAWRLRSSSTSFRCVLSNLCGSQTTSLAGLSVCRADLNCDVQVDFIDFLTFLNLYIAQDLAADFTADGLVDFADYLEFLNLYNAGC